MAAVVALTLAALARPGNCVSDDQLGNDAGADVVSEADAELEQAEDAEAYAEDAESTPVMTPFGFGPSE